MNNSSISKISNNFHNRPAVVSTQPGMNHQIPSSNVIQTTTKNHDQAHLQSMQQQQQQQQQFQQQQHCKMNQNSSSKDSSQTNYYGGSLQTQNLQQLPKQSANENQFQQSQSAILSISPGFSGLNSFPVSNEQIFEQLQRHEELLKQMFELMNIISKNIQKSESPNHNDNPNTPNNAIQLTRPKINIYLAESSACINEMRFKELNSFLQTCYQIETKILKEKDPVLENSVIFFPVLFTTPRSPSADLIASIIKKFRRNNTPLVSVALVYTEVWSSDVPMKPDSCEAILYYGVSHSKGIYNPIEVNEKNKLQVDIITQGRLI